MKSTPEGSWKCNCGADNPTDSPACWLCLRGRSEPTTVPLPADASESSGRSAVPPVVLPPDAIAAMARRPSNQFSLATLFLCLTLGAVMMGLFVIAPGLGIAFAILTVPAFLRTTLLVRSKESRGQLVPTERKTILFLSSIATSVVVLVVVLVASVGTFCAVCLSSGREATIPIAIAAAVVPTIGVVILMIVWIRHRWRRDVRKPY